MSTVPSPVTTTEALGMLSAALGFLTTADATQMATEEQAQCLQALERFNSMSTVARASILGAFTAGRGYCEDGDYSPRSWLIHRTRVTKGAAAAYTAWARHADAQPQPPGITGPEPGNTLAPHPWAMSGWPAPAYPHT